ncbi:MAG: transcription elongation factor GreA [Eubacteriaceae bacterium]|nr:transcription elongation factor GreA [Eubacteriaceae bacterium]
MTEKEVFLTKEGYDELVSRLEYLQTTKRHEIAEKIKAARDFGDLSENAEYEEAKTEQAFMEGEILELEFKVKNAVLIDEKKSQTDVASVGSKVTVIDFGDDEEIEYLIVGSDEADLAHHRISNESPMGKAIIGAKVGDVVQVAAPFASYEIKIVSIV